MKWLNFLIIVLWIAGMSAVFWGLYILFVPLAYLFLGVSLLNYSVKLAKQKGGKT